MTTQTVSPEALPGLKICDDRYKVLSKIGAGAMGLVFRAYDHRLETDVVIKVPMTERMLDADSRERFIRECRLLGRLAHPHIVQILDVGDHEEIPFVVMQCLTGGTLRDRMVGPEGLLYPLSSSSLTSWLREVAKALDYVHGENIVHRDVKPSNILFDEQGNPFLSDFGLTKILYGDHRDLTSDSTIDGGIIGTPNYLAPEMVLGNEFDGRADQYSLAIAVYELLTGRPPMQGRSASATMVNQTRKVLPLLSEVRDEISERLAKAVRKGCARSPEKRFSSCVEFAEAVLSGVTESPKKQRRRGSSSAAGLQPRSTRKLRAGDTQSDRGSSRANRRSSATRQRRKTSKGRRGKVSCPECNKVLPLYPMHSGRTGRCIHCNVRLEVSKGIDQLTVISESPSTSKRPPRQSNKKRKNAAGEFALGERVFGIQISRRVAPIVVGSLITLLVGIAVFISLFSTSESENLERIEVWHSFEDG